MLSKLLNSLIVLETAQNANVSEIVKKILIGIQKIGPWLCGLLAAVCVGILTVHVIKFFMAKNQGNDQDAEKSKKGMIWSVALLVVCALFTTVFAFIVDIANAFGAGIVLPEVSFAVIEPFLNLIF